MGDIASGASALSIEKYLAIADKDDALQNISAYIEDAGEALPFIQVSDKEGNAFWDTPLTAGGGIRTINVPVRRTDALNDLLEGLAAAQATTGTPQHWDYEYGYEGNVAGKQKISGTFVLGQVSWNAPKDSKQDGTFEMQLRSRTVGTF